MHGIMNLKFSATLTGLQQVAGTAVILCTLY